MMDTAADATDTTPLPASPDRLTVAKQFGAGFLPALAVSSACSLLSYWNAGRSLGTILGPVLLVPVIVPFLVAGEKGLVGRLSAMAGVWVGVGWLWIWAMSERLMLWHNWMAAMSILGAWVVALAGMVVLLSELRLPRPLTGAFVTIIGLAWLTWPVWLSPVLAGHERTLTYLADLNPLLVTNWTVQHLGLWSSPMGGSSLAYRYLTNLNQDVAYPAGRHLWPVWLVCGGGGSILFIAGWALGASRTEEQALSSRPSTQ